MDPSGSKLAEWEVLERREVYSAPPFLALSVDRVRLPDGHVVENFHRIEKPDYALVVPRCRDGRILLLRSYKHGIGAIGLHPPGGHLDKGESPLTAVQRELLEETGYTAARWHSLGSYVTDANQGVCRGHFFMAEDAHPVAEPASGDLEEMELVWLAPDELQASIHAGEVNSLGAIAAITLAFNAGLLNPKSCDNQ
ncbi:NUDIX hydrolase [Novipirellula artificiosorum]|uniref:ADP-ribose pyrophosphatase n=1 Tax=Novipirellula artificiosorum TaxID=2528016 RepID=A0A5C6DSI6_9BACT|nr:NUDIX hydrolase [Novipirellula artificiosorum]TWU39592.1 ADP-ribose pyrophosphatase [Novipirellula artificiosorum]